MKKLLTARTEINDVRDDLCAAFLAAGILSMFVNVLECLLFLVGIPLEKIAHPSLRGFFGKATKFSGCYPKDQKDMKPSVERVYKVLCCPLPLVLFDLSLLEVGCIVCVSVSDINFQFMIITVSRTEARCGVAASSGEPGRGRQLR